jgi:hypothetical protein
MRRTTPLLTGAALAWLSVLAAPSPAPAQAARAAPVAAPAAPFIQQFEQQYANQFRQVYRLELHLMRVVCQPTRQEYDRIAADGEPAVKEALRKCAESMQGPHRGGQEPHALLAEAIARSVKASLSAEQAARYQKELELRDAARKRATVRNLVGKVDKLLLLTNEQRDRLAGILETHWNAAWNQTQWLTYSAAYFPPMPDTEILAILTEPQKTVWRGAQKVNILFGFDVGILPGMEVEDEVWDDPLPRKPERADKVQEPLPTEKKP